MQKVDEGLNGGPHRWVDIKSLVEHARYGGHRDASPSGNVDHRHYDAIPLPICHLGCLLNPLSYHAPLAPVRMRPQVRDSGRALLNPGVPKIARFLTHPWGCHRSIVRRWRHEGLGRSGHNSSARRHRKNVRRSWSMIVRAMRCPMHRVIWPIDWRRALPFRDPALRALPWWPNDLTGPSRSFRSDVRFRNARSLWQELSEDLANTLDQV